jgi:hypothetical protein
VALNALFLLVLFVLVDHNGTIISYVGRIAAKFQGPAAGGGAGGGGQSGGGSGGGGGGSGGQRPSTSGEIVFHDTQEDPSEKYVRFCLHLTV